jgi:hypothetical protein
MSPDRFWLPLANTIEVARHWPDEVAKKPPMV